MRPQKGSPKKESLPAGPSAAAAREEHQLESLELMLGSAMLHVKSVRGPASHSQLPAANQGSCSQFREESGFRVLGTQDLGFRV